MAPSARRVFSNEKSGTVTGAAVSFPRIVEPMMMIVIAGRISVLSFIFLFEGLVLLNDQNAQEKTPSRSSWVVFIDRTISHCRDPHKSPKLVSAVSPK